MMRPDTACTESADTMMIQYSVKKWVLLVACLVEVAASDVAFAQIGMWPGAPGYGGLYGGYSGYRGYETGYPANAYGSERVYGNGNTFYEGLGPRGIRGGIYYSQPIDPTTRRPRPLFNRQPSSSAQPFDGSVPNRIYSGSSPVITTPTVISTSPPVVYDNGEIIVFSPPNNSVDVQYALNGVSYTMKPGTLQKFANDRTWTIDVNLGNGQHAKYTLSTGRFKFKQSETGIGLFSTKDSPDAPAPVPEPDSTAIPANDLAAPVPMPGE